MRNHKKNSLGKKKASRLYHKPHTSIIMGQFWNIYFFKIKYCHFFVVLQWLQACAIFIPSSQLREFTDRENTKIVLLILWQMINTPCFTRPETVSLYSLGLNTCVLKLCYREMSPAFFQCILETKRTYLLVHLQNFICDKVQGCIELKLVKRVI